MIITISGNPGSGKSTVAMNIADKFAGERIYAGRIFREMAKQQGMALEEFLQYTEIHPEIHHQVDQKIVKEARKIDRDGRIAVVEGRVQFHFIPESFKIFLAVSLDESAKRILQDLRDPQAKRSRNENSVSTVEEMKERIRKRIVTDQERYSRLYQIDILDQSKFDLVIDTTSLTPEQVVQVILNNLPL